MYLKERFFCRYLRYYLLFKFLMLYLYFVSNILWRDNTGQYKSINGRYVYDIVFKI